MLDAFAEFISELQASEMSGPLLLDLLLHAEASVVLPRLRHMDVALLRREPSRGCFHKIQRRLGVFTRPSGLNVVVKPRTGIEAGALLSGEVIWTADWFLYPQPAGDLERMPNPHVDYEGFARHVAWSLSQETGVSSWLLAGRGHVERVSDAVVKAFARQGMTAVVVPVDAHQGE